MARRALLTAALLVLLGAADARACSCESGSPREALRAADHAFTGRIVKIRRGDIRSVFTFKVRRVLKGDFGRRVRVRTMTEESLCGLSGEVGDRAGLILDRRRGRWEGHLCAQFGARELERAASRLEGARSGDGLRPCGG